MALSLADNANDSGDCWPSIANICGRTNLSERTVQTAIRDLELTGFLAIRVKSGSSNRYHLTPAAYAPPQMPHPATDAPTPATVAPQPPQELHPTPAAVAPRIVIEPSEEPSGNRHAPRARLEVSRGTFDGWEFIDQRMRPAYPRGTYRHSAWMLAARAVERVVAAGASPDEIAANAAAYCAQQEAEGNAGTRFVMSPANWLEKDNWRGPFPVSASKAQRQQDANISTSLQWLNDQETARAAG